ncbi:glycoside hydrolase family 16 protein [Glonium stellatum]|uniref:endo-1,3(4)-beta-glucanase n=1 Tax=Glonium stellatum TaxID=574774 RepID=A0A8E2ERZ7_9PEZI|nr:glycoside hydrolase family 16 protein [Glonium stellatum]
MPSPSFVLGVGALFLSSVFSPANAVKRATTGYTLIDSFKGNNFFDNFDFFTGPDPTTGFVDYKDNVTAHNLGLASVSNGAAFMRVDDQNTYAPPPNSNGRPSVRISSKKTYTKGLFIADIAHMPGSICGVWPAFWSFGPNWPNSGEIDILEGVDKNQKNKISLHSGDNCKVTPTLQSGTANGNDCAVSTSGSGCAVDDVSTMSYGDGFNNVNGGVYAMEWTSTSIKVWFFPRAAIPISIKTGKPDVSTFGVPVAYFTGCDFDSHFANHQIVFDTTFCGTWAGQYDYVTTTCPSAADGWAGCVVDVGSNPSWFTDAYWEINSVEIYQQKAASSSTSSSVSSTTKKASSLKHYEGLEHYEGLKHNVENLNNIEILEHNIESLKHNIESLKHNVEGLKHNVKGFKYNIKSLEHNVKGFKHNIKDFKHNIKDFKHNVQSFKHF